MQTNKNLLEAGPDECAKEHVVLHNSRRLTISNAPAISVADSRQAGEDAPLAFGTCFMIWVGMMVATWGAIAFIGSLF